MQQLVVKITGKSPMLIHYRNGARSPEGFEKWSPEKQAEHHVLRSSKTGELIIPVQNMLKALINGAKWCKGKGRGSLASLAASVMLIAEDELSLSTKNYSIDHRVVVIKASGGSCDRFRARLNTWKTSFTIVYDENFLSEAQVKNIVTCTGQLEGLGDYRPGKRGPFGRFEAKF